MYLACHGCCGQGNAGFRTCRRAGACRKCCCLVRQVSKDAYPGTWQLSSTSVSRAGAVNSKGGKEFSPKSVGADLLWAFQKLHWKELKGGKWRVERAVPDFKVPFSEFSSKCWRQKFVFVSVLSPLPISFFLFQLHSSGEGAEKMEEDPSWRHMVEGGAAVGSSLYKGKSG